MMNRKNSLWLSASFLMGTAAVTAQQVKKPHIILIMTDQQRGDCLGIQQSFIKTPNLDALAREGICFDKGYSTTPSSTPARAALLTGLSPWASWYDGVWSGSGALSLRNAPVVAGKGILYIWYR